MKKVIAFLCLLHVCYGVIYRLNETEYDRMPPIYAADPYEKCYWDPDAVYCYGEFVLVSDTPSPLLDMIHEYSAHTTTHLNHTKIRRGLCLTQSCKKFNITSMGLKSTLEGCLNESIYETYQLKTRVLDMYYCNQPPKDMQPDNLDIGVGMVCGVIVLANLIGSLYEIYCGDRKDCFFRFLLCFSIRRNWRKLLAPVAQNQDPRLRRLKSLHGVRALSMIFVIMAHSLLGCVWFIENADFLEKMYHNEIIKAFEGGTIIMQTFFVMSGFLLIYNALLRSEKSKIKWGMLPHLLFVRWLRLTPPYAVVLGLTVTWLRYLTSGPLWKEMVEKEAMDCRVNWWRNILYINNYYDDSQCMSQMWYIAADTQLYCIGVIVFVLYTTQLSRKILLPMMFVAGCMIPGVVTYLYDLDAFFMPYPESINELFMLDPTYNYTFKRGHMNIAGYTLGLSIGYLVYHWQKKGIDVSRWRKYRYCVPMLVLMGTGVIYSCSFFFDDIPRPSVYIRAACASVFRPTFAFLVCLLLICFIFKVDDLCRHIVEWRGWLIPSRLSYCAYLLHIFFNRNYVGFQTTVTHISFVTMAFVFTGIVLASFLTSLPFYLLVEAPAGNLIREFVTKSKDYDDKAEDEKQNGTKAVEEKPNGSKAEEVKQNGTKAVEEKQSGTKAVEEKQNGTRGENPKKELSDAEKDAIEKIISLEDLREILCVERQTRF
ncbi:hypothetical protein PYW07_005518 [Mythimna separata]|uniref:Acyltransferase 3 domain-containing protein n=1 Tax=Mythimna separata TaxID=271217 RepID=A0AAD7YK05_MYTSE|nr:hypothetical protein PYW07_005518 [Mythimna separata]